MAVLLNEDELNKKNPIELQNYERQLQNIMNAFNARFLRLIEPINEPENVQNNPKSNDQNDQTDQNDQDELAKQTSKTKLRIKQIQEQLANLKKQHEKTQLKLTKLQKQQKRHHLEIQYLRSGISQQQKNNNYYMKYHLAKIQLLLQQCKNKHQEEDKVKQYQMNLDQKLSQLKQQQVQMLIKKKQICDNRIAISRYFFTNRTIIDLVPMFILANFFVVSSLCFKKQIQLFYVLQYIIFISTFFIKIKKFNNFYSPVKQLKYSFRPYNANSEKYVRKRINISIHEFYLLKFLLKQFKDKQIKQTLLVKTGIQTIALIVACLLIQIGIYELGKFIDTIF